MSSARQLSHGGKWLALVNSTVLQDMDRSAIPRTAAAYKAATTLPIHEGLFAPKTALAEQGLPSGFVRQVMSSKRAWKTPGPKFFDEIPLMWRAAVACHPSSDAPAIVFNSFAIVGTVIQNTEHNGLVVYASSSMIVLWRVNVDVVEGERLFRMCCKGNLRNWVTVSIQRSEDWKGATVSAVPPSSMRSQPLDGKGRPKICLHLRPIHKPVPFLQLAAASTPECFGIVALSEPPWKLRDLDEWTLNESRMHPISGPGGGRRDFGSCSLRSPWSLDQSQVDLGGTSINANSKLFLLDTLSTRASLVV